MKYKVFRTKYFESLDDTTLDYMVSDILFNLEQLKDDLVRNNWYIDNLCSNLKRINKVIFERAYGNDN